MNMNFPEYEYVFAPHFSVWCHIFSHIIWKIPDRIVVEEKGAEMCSMHFIKLHIFHSISTAERANHFFMKEFLLFWVETQNLNNFLSVHGFIRFGDFIWQQLMFSQKSCFLGPNQLAKSKYSLSKYVISNQIFSKRKYVPFLFF